MVKEKEKEQRREGKKRQSGWGGQRVAVVGGCGFVGRSVLQRLRARGVHCCSLDVIPPPAAAAAAARSGGSTEEDEEEHFTVDVSDAKQVREALQSFSPSCVVHLAGWGMSGSPMLSSRCHTVNTLGTKNVIAVCQELARGSCDGKQDSCPIALVYLSTYNVVFGGQEICGGSEELPYFEGQHSDQYAPSKTLADKAVLEANSSELRTCVLRPAAIYGPEEERHFPRIIEVMDSGLFLFRIGHALVDWVHIDNLVQSIELAILKLVEEDNRESSHTSVPDVAGEAFFIADGTPIDNFDFLIPLCEARGVRSPLVYLPVNVAMLMARCAEALFYFTAFLFGEQGSVEPFLTIPEVLKVGVTHYFSIEKARRYLKYNPTMTTLEGRNEMAAHYRTHNVGSLNYFQIVHPVVALFIAMGMGLLTFFAIQDDSAVSSISILNQFKSLGYSIFGSRFGLQVVLIFVHVAHVFESYQALAICNELGVRRRLKWCWVVQTFIFGIGSLSMLHARKDFMTSLKKRD